jgi:anti-sigma factor ChrR (cupin superfamily)
MSQLNFKKRVVIKSESIEWGPSSEIGAQSKNFESERNAHTTSIICYEKGSSVSVDSLSKGEEIFILKGDLSDDNSKYSEGTYLRIPPGSNKKLETKNGCVIYTKRNQIHQSDRESLRVDTKKSNWHKGYGGLEVMPLHEFEREHVALVKWPAGERFVRHQHFGGEEILVLSGEFQDEHGSYPKNTWIRSPHLSQHLPFVKEETIILVKTGHLPIAV